MVKDLSIGNEILKEFAALVYEKRANPFNTKLKAGVDLGTANIVVSVVDENNRPIAGATHYSSVVKDGIVVDYIGATQIVSSLKKQLEDMLGVTLDKAATAIPPQIIEGNIKVIANVVEACGFEVTNIVDEPTAAATVLGITDGAVVDVGGGTTGISILKNGEVVYTNDEPTGGTHMTLVLSGAKRLTFEEGELLKRDTEREREVFPIIRPVVEKMASIIKRYVDGKGVDVIYVVGGAACFTDFENVFEKYLKIPTIKPAEPLLVTPLGIAMNCKVSTD